MQPLCEQQHGLLGQIVLLLLFYDNCDKLARKKTKDGRDTNHRNANEISVVEDRNVKVWQTGFLLFSCQSCFFQTQFMFFLIPYFELEQQPPPPIKVII